jgi:hypothetical protein
VPQFIQDLPKRMGVKYPGCHLVKETVDERTPAEAIDKVVNPGYVKQSLRTA